MKVFIIILLFVVSFEKSNAQNFIDHQRKLKAICKRKIRKEFVRSITSSDWMNRLEAYSLLGQFKIIPVISFEINPDAIKYDTTTKIINYLRPSESFPFESAIFLKKSKFFATLDCFNTVYYEDCKPCNYDDSSEEKDFHYNYEVKKFYSAISSRKYTLIFKVQYFRNSVWFIENKNVKIYCTQDRLIYDPDEYIKKRCSVETIRDLAIGKLHAFCD